MITKLHALCDTRTLQQLSYQPKEDVLFYCSLRPNPAGTSITSTLDLTLKPTLLVPAWSMAPGASRYSHRMCAPRQETTADVRVYI